MSNPKIQIENDEARYRIRPQVLDNAEEDKTFVKIAPGRAREKGIELDKNYFPTKESLEKWHKKNNAHLFGE